MDSKAGEALMMPLSRGSRVGNLLHRGMDVLPEPRCQPAPGKAADHVGFFPACPTVSARGSSNFSPPWRDSCSATQWPHAEYAAENERHLSSVACTRARDHLLVTGVAPASQFLADLHPVHDGEAQERPGPGTEHAAALCGRKV